MRPDALDEMIRADLAAGATPCAIIAGAGTTGVTAFDPLGGLAEIALRHAAWLHVDAAMAGSGLILPELRWRFEGLEQADSLVFNAHKWLGVPFDCSLYYVRDAQHLQRVMSTNPSYLATPQDELVKNYRDWGVPLGRRFRALKLWFVIREQGVAGLHARLRRDLDNARWLAEQVEATANWRLVEPLRLQTVCLRHEPPGLTDAEIDAHTRAWVERINASGEAWLTAAQIGERWIARVSVGAVQTERADVEAGWAILRAAAEACG
jgi:aromatic-L-amino-acid decarboxylase